MYLSQTYFVYVYNKFILQNKHYFNHANAFQRFYLAIRRAFERKAYKIFEIFRVIC